MIRRNRLLLAALGAWAALAVSSRAPGAAPPAEAYVATGVLQSRRDADRAVTEYYVLGERDGVRYALIPPDGADWASWLGRRVGVRGVVRMRPGGQAALVRRVEMTLLPDAPSAASRPAPGRQETAPGPLAGSAVRSVQHEEPLPPPPEAPEPPELPPLGGSAADELVEPGPALDEEAGPELFELLPFSEGQPGEGNVELAPLEGSGGDAAPAGCGECGAACSVCDPCRCGHPGRLWGRVEYLVWWTSGMNLPPLVTASRAGTALGDAGVLGRDTTTILFGNDDVLTDDTSGGRVRAGWWYDASRRAALEGEWFGLDQDSVSFLAASDADGYPILGRPFFNINPRNPDTGERFAAAEDAQLVSFPGLLTGLVTVDAASSLSSAGVWERYNVGCGQGGGLGQWLLAADAWRFDVLLGYRYLRLNDHLVIREQLEALAPPGEFAIFDRFDARNEFHGAEIGVMWERRRRRWNLEIIGRLALGAVSQDVHAEGRTRFVNALGQTTDSFGGLLVQRTNGGLHGRDRFAVLPQLGVTVDWRVAPRLTLTVGYSLLYLTPAARAGDQIELDVNPDLLPPEADPFTGAERPGFVFREADYWAQGLNVGLDYYW